MSTTMNEQSPIPNLVLPEEETLDQPPPAYTESTTQPPPVDRKQKNSPPKDEKKRTIDIDVRSVTSTSTSTSDTSTLSLSDFSSTLLPNITFTPGPTFHIAARGIEAIRLPVPSSELEIDIFNPDFSVAYTSIRARRSKGDCVLSSPSRGDLVSTNYFIGPNRQPIFKDLTSTTTTSSSDLSSEIDSTYSPDTSLFEIKSKWVSRTITLLHRPSGNLFEWSYDKTKSPTDGTKANLLVLRLKTPTSPEIHNETAASTSTKDKVLAQLLRSPQTRTPGSSACSAGNGGQLIIEKNASEWLAEELIVATCLMMLKKEIDRRRAVQFAVLAGAASGGS